MNIPPGRLMKTYQDSATAMLKFPEFKATIDKAIAAGNTDAPTPPAAKKKTATPKK